MDYEYTTANLDQDTDLLETLEDENNSNSYALNFSEKYLFIIIRTFFFVLIVANNTCLIIAIRKFDRLRTRTNYIILNFTIVNLAFSIIGTLDHLRLSFEYQIETSYTIIVTILMNLLPQTCYILAAFLIIDWFVVATFKNCDSKYQKWYGWILASCYLIPLLCFIPFFIAGFHYYSVLVLFYIILYWVSFILMVIINIIKYFQKSSQYVYGLCIGNMYLIIWCPFMVICSTYNIIELSLSPVMMLVSQFLYLVGFLAPIVMTFMLIKQDKNFKMSYYSMFKRSPPTNLQVESNIEENA